MLLLKIVQWLLVVPLHKVQVLLHGFQSIPRLASTYSSSATPLWPTLSSNFTWSSLKYCTLFSYISEHALFLLPEIFFPHSLSSTISVCPWYHPFQEASPNMTHLAKGPLPRALLCPCSTASHSLTCSAAILSRPFSPHELCSVGERNGILFSSVFPSTYHRAGVPPKCLES